MNETNDTIHKEKLIILGTGPAGGTAALYAARADLAPLVFEGDAPGGQLMGTTELENFPGFTGTGPELVMKIKEQAKSFGAKTTMKRITKVDFSDPQNLKLWSGQNEYHTQSLIIATGAKAKWLNLGKGEEKFWGKGYTACATCDGAFFRNKIVAVVGGGDSACEEASFLTRYASKVYMIVRRDELRASKPMQKRVMENEKIEILWQKSVIELNGDNLLSSVTLKNNAGGDDTTLELNGLFMAIGHIPNTDFLEGHIDLRDNKYIDVKGDTKSNVPSVFIAGDCADYQYRQAITAAGMGCKAAMDVEHYITSLSE